ncbi:MAG: CotH kinase family protein [Flavobacteriales bacterium]|nr:CotH kinase family protein [Flavobacteriales bacterium]MBK7942000.1 CotH kinase family protein [Flavobacteriales bacterium]MBK9700545.1 CotH kinase family protein [Flavobacteriales bacterium]
MRLLTTLSAAFAATALLSQTAPSDSLFDVDQVVEVHLTFSDPDFWTTLVTYHNNDQGEELMGSVTITDQTGTWTYDSVSVALKGNSSYSHPGDKKSFKLDFNDFIDQKFHGMRKLHFNNCWSDPTFMREKIFFDYCQEQGIRAPRVQYANIHMNGTLWGFYNLVEAVDKEFLDRHIDDDAGNLFKAADNFGMGGGGGGGAAEADMKWYGTDQADYVARYELKTNETVNDWSDLLDLLDMLNNAPDAYLETNFPPRWNWHDLLRSLALDNLFGNLDAYIQSARNYYLYHDATNDEWQWVHWDANMAFGSYPAQGQNALTLSPTYMAANRPLMTRLMAIESFRTDYLNEYCWAKENFTNGYLDPRIDSLATMIQPHVAADPNKQYTLAQFTTNITSDITVQGGGGGGGGQQTIRGLKSFVTARNSSLATTLDCSTVGLSEVAAEAAFRVYPNPASEVLWLRLAPGVSIAAVRMLDALGRAVPAPVHGDGVDVSGLAPGLYMVSVSDGALVRTARFEKR